MKSGTCPTPAVLGRAFAEGAPEAMAAHAADCARCTALLQELASLRELSRALPEDEVAPDHLRAIGREIVAKASVVRAPPRWITPAMAAACGAAAAAAAVLLVVNLDALEGDVPRARGEPAVASVPGRAPARGTLTPQPGAVLEHRTHHPSSPGGELAEVVRLRDGQVRFDVTRLAQSERFLVVTGDAEVEVRGTSFDVDVHEDRLRRVLVHEGRVEVRAAGAAPVLLGAGARWIAPGEAEAVPTVAPAAEPAARALRRRTPVLPAPAPEGTEEPQVIAGVLDRAAEDGVDGVEESPPAPEEPAPTGAERAFSAGWDALRGGDPHLAARHLADVPLDDPLGEEATYWHIVALGRAERTPEAIVLMERFLAAFPGSSRAGEIALMLGLRRLERGELALAERHLRAALEDPSARVKDRARDGLAALRTIRTGQ